jgi:hypothetical protein
MKGGATKAELAKPSNVIHYTNEGGVETYCSNTAASRAERAKAKAKAEADAKVNATETHEERLARLMAQAGKPYYRRLFICLTHRS